MLVTVNERMWFINGVTIVSYLLAKEMVIATTSDELPVARNISLITGPHAFPPMSLLLQFGWST